MKTFLDLRPHYNAKTVFDRTDSESVWIDGNCHCFDTEAFVFDRPVEEGDISAVFRRNDEGFDSIFCCKQEIVVPNIPCNRIAIAGVCVWGYFKERFEFVFDDGSSEPVRAMFSDAAWPMNKSSEAGFELRRQECEDMTKILYESECRGNRRYVYYSAETFYKKGRRLEKIRIPDNMLMYLYAVTLED